MSTPRVSVIMAVYNGARDLPQSLPSVLSQDFTDLELVIVDDGSTDGTRDVIEAFRDPRIVYHRNPGNRGQTGSLNVALGLARGALIARIDADDAYRSGKLAHQVAFLDAHPEVDVLGTWALRRDAAGRTIGEFHPPTEARDIAFHLLHSSPICHVSVVMRREAVLAVGGYDESYQYAADYKLWSDLHAHGCAMANLPRVLTEYRVDEGTFGGRNLLGAAGDEAAAIIRRNAGRLGYRLSPGEARAIFLRTTPGAGVGMWDRAGAYVQMRELAGRAYPRVPLRVRARLFLGAIWSLTRAQREGDSGGEGRLGQDARRRVHKHPAALAAMVAAHGARLLGSNRLTALKEQLVALRLRRHV